MLAQGLQDAAEALRRSDFSGALDILRPFTGSHGDIADVWQLLALAHKGLGDVAAAEDAFLKSIALDPQPHVLTNLANLYRGQGNFPAARQRYEEALALTPDHLPARVNCARTLMDLGDFTAAADAFRKILADHPKHTNATVGLAQALQRLGQQEQALGLFQSVLEANPGHPAALNGIGIALKTLGYAEDAVEHLQAGVRVAPDSPQINANLASALAQADREEEAVAAYRRAIELAPDDPDVHDWFNGYLGVIEHPDYLASYQEALARTPGNAPLALALARKLLLNGRSDEASVFLQKAVEAGGELGQLLAEQSHVFREQGDFDAALDHARRARALDDNSPAVSRELATALMAADGDHQEAVGVLQQLLEQHPQDQGLWALYLTALRYTGQEARYRALCDYNQLIDVRHIEPTQAFADRGELVAHLREALEALHTTRRHPVEQSVVGGTQTLDDLFSRRHPSVALLTERLAEQLANTVAALPDDPEHPLLSRKGEGIQFSDSWSIRLRDGGYHKNHFHSQGWLSSALYLTVPESINHSSPQGWIKFGEPGFRARRPLSAEYWLKPEEGALVVFPSYLWHGTEPLTVARERMTVGYDVLPL